MRAARVLGSILAACPAGVTHGYAITEIEPEPRLVNTTRPWTKVPPKPVNGQSKIANKANVLFIAAARDNIPRLIAEVRRLHRQLEDTVAKDDQEVKRSTTIDYCSWWSDQLPWWPSCLRRCYDSRRRRYEATGLSGALQAARTVPDLVALPMCKKPYPSSR
jgi:hypothetical protein